MKIGNNNYHPQSSGSSPDPKKKQEGEFKCSKLLSNCDNKLSLQNPRRYDQ